MQSKARVYKCRVNKKITSNKLPTILELQTLQDNGIDTTEYALFAINQYKKFLSHIDDNKDKGDKERLQGREKEIKEAI